MKNITEFLSRNYPICDIVDIKKDEDAANDVYLIKLINGEKLVYKVFSKDVAPSTESVLLLEKLAKIFSELPKIISNKNNKKIINISPTKKSFLITFQSGVHLDKVQLNSVILKSVVKIISYLNKIQLNSSLIEPWYLLALNEINNPSSLSKEIENISLSNCSKGFIHGDLNHLNILVKDGKLSGIIDWDGVHYDYIVTDLAIFIAHNVLKDDSKISVVDTVNEYVKYCSLTEQDFQLLPVFIKLRIQQILAMLKSRMATNLTEKKEIPEHITIWENKYNLLVKYLN